MNPVCRLVVSAILCLIPALTIVSHDAMAWLLSSPIERILRFDDEPQEEMLDNPRMRDDIWAATASNETNRRRRAYYLVTVLHETGRIA